MTPFRALTLSLFFHVSLGFLFLFLEDLLPQKEVQSVEVLYTPEKAPLRQVLRDTEVSEDTKTDTPSKARFHSLTHRRVKKEMRAAHSGATKNRSQKRATKRKMPPKEPALEALKAKGYDLTPQFQNLGASTVGDSLPDEISIGSFTALNTDRHLYYSFYMRAEELIRHRWESRVHQSIRVIQSKKLAKKKKLRKSLWKTRLKVLLKPDGSLHKILMTKKSGFSLFDFSAAQAFREAKFFPHPPEEMVGRDGYIHLTYEFLVRWNPSQGIHFY